MQLDQQVEALGRSCNVRHLLVLGGMDQFAQATELRKRPHIVVATPGRLADMMNTAEDLQQGFRRTAVLVLDEADRVLEPCFEQPLRDIMKVPQAPSVGAVAAVHSHAQTHHQLYL